mgnify:CR=1 FL=1
MCVCVSLSGGLWSLRQGAVLIPSPLIGAAQFARSTASEMDPSGLELGCTFAA